LPEIVEALRRLPSASLVLDGELVIPVDRDVRVFQPLLLIILNPCLILNRFRRHPMCIIEVAVTEDRLGDSPT
jgi:hypothetical protein